MPLQPHIKRWLHHSNLPLSPASPIIPSAHNSHNSRRYKSFTCSYYSVLPLKLSSAAQRLLLATAAHQKWTRLSGEEGVMYQDWNGVRELESTLLHKARKVVEGVLHGELEESQRIEELLRSINEPPELEEGSSLSATTTTPTTPKDINIDIAINQGWGRCDNEHYYIDESGFVLPLKPRMECENGNWILYFENEQGVVVNVDIGAGIESYRGRKKMLEQREAYQGNVVKLG